MTSITTNDTYVEIFRIERSKDINLSGLLSKKFDATIEMKGTFGGGTLGLYLSLTGESATPNTIDDALGNAYTTMINKTVPLSFNVGSDNTSDIVGYAKITGATTPNVTITVEANVIQS